MKSNGLMTVPKNLNQCFVKVMEMAFLFYSKDLNMQNLLLIIWTVNIKISIFLLKRKKKMSKYLSLMSPFSVKMVSF